jgi:hypothetical protein
VTERKASMERTERARANWRRAARLLAAAFLTGVVIGGAAPVAAKKKKPKATFVYVHDNGNTPGVHGFAVDRLTGDLGLIPGSPFAAGTTSANCGGFCQTLAYSPQKKLLFVGGADGVHVFSVAKDGVLTEVPGSPFGGTLYYGVETLTKGGKTFVYAADYTANSIAGFRVGNGGALTPLNGFPLATAAEPVGLAVAGGRLFVASQSAKASVYTVSGNGQLTPVSGSPVTLGGLNYNVAPDPGGGFFYVPDDTSGVIHGFSTAAGLAGISGSPFTLAFPGGGGGLVLGPAGVGALFFDAGVQPVTRNAAGVLANSGSFQNFGLSGPDSAAFTDDGAFLAVASSNTDTVRLYSVTPGTGQLLPTDTEPAALANTNANDTVFAVR